MWLGPGAKSWDSMYKLTSALAARHNIVTFCLVGTILPFTVTFYSRYSVRKYQTALYDVLQISRDVEVSHRSRQASSSLKTGPWTIQLTACVCGPYAIPRGRPLNWRSLILTWKRRASFSASAMTTWLSTTEHNLEQKNTVSEDKECFTRAPVYETL